MVGDTGVNFVGKDSLHALEQLFPARRDNIAHGRFTAGDLRADGVAYFLADFGPRCVALFCNTHSVTCDGNCTDGRQRE